MVSSTLKLGISILNGGNCDVQQVRVSPGKSFKCDDEQRQNCFHPSVFTENVGLSEGQKRCWFLPQHSVPDADLQVRRLTDSLSS